MASGGWRFGGAHRFRSHAIFYVGVPDVEAALQKAEDLGGKRLLGPARNEAGGVVVATSLTLRATWLVSPGRSDPGVREYSGRLPGLR